VDCVANFAIILLFPALTTAFGLPMLMVLLAILAVLAIGFVARYLPETKNLTLDEVTHIFDKQAATTHPTLMGPAFFGPGFYRPLRRFLAFQPGVVNFLRRAISKS
jgi:Sugar (and other) transporter